MQENAKNGVLFFDSDQVTSIWKKGANLHQEPFSTSNAFDHLYELLSSSWEWKLNYHYDFGFYEENFEKWIQLQVTFRIGMVGSRASVFQLAEWCSENVQVLTVKLLVDSITNAHI